MAADAAPAVANEMITIPAARLAELVLTENKYKIRAHANIASLRKKYTPPPEIHAQRMLEKYHKNKEAINARRRELYRKKKEARAAAAATTPSGGFSVDP